jgi:hypothetical protein
MMKEKYRRDNVMKRALLFISILALFCVFAPTLAQDDANTIEYGQTVTGEITNRNFEIEYRFVGAAGDVILAEMSDPQEYSGPLDSPGIILLDAKYNVISSVDGYGGSVQFFAELPASGDYSILATRADGRAGTSLGEFNLTLSKLPVLEPGEAISGKIPADTTDFYAVVTDKPFTVAYERLTRGLYPEMNISTLYNNQPRQIATLRGDTLVSGSIGITPESDTEGTLAYVISVETSYSFDESVVEYTVMLEE